MHEDRRTVLRIRVYSAKAIIILDTLQERQRDTAITFTDTPRLQFQWALQRCNERPSDHLWISKYLENTL